MPLDTCFGIITPPRVPKYSMRLFEFFSPNIPLTPYRDEDDLNGYTFHCDGREYFVGFQDEGDDTYYMSFTGENERGQQSAWLLNHNHPFRVFSGVMSAILTFIHQHEPNQISFDVAGNEMKRISTYDRILDMAERNGSIPEPYVWDRPGDYRYYIFRDGYR